MKLKQTIRLHKTPDDFLALGPFDGLIRNNESAHFLYTLLMEEHTGEELLRALLEEYQVDEDLARRDLEEFLTLLQREGLLEEEQPR